MPWSTKPMTAKERIRELLEAQPDDASYDEILRELAFERMVDRGMSDVRQGRVVSNEEMSERIRSFVEDMERPALAEVGWFGVPRVCGTIAGYHRR